MKNVDVSFDTSLLYRNTVLVLCYQYSQYVSIYIFNGIQIYTHTLLINLKDYNENGLF